MAQHKTRFVTIKEYIGDRSVEEKDFHLEEKTVPALGDNQLLLKLEFLSVDPYMRGRLSGRKSYVDPFKLGEPIQGFLVASVAESKSSAFHKGDLVQFMGDWSDLQVKDAATVKKLPPGAPAEVALGVCGLTGLTAYFGLLSVGQLKEGDTVLVTGAAGATGYAVGSIAKLKNCKVIGIAGSADKVQFLKELGFDVCLNYKTDNLREEIPKAAKDGINVFFDNVGGEIADIVRENMAPRGRIAQCGAISEYNSGKPSLGPRVDRLMVFKRIRWEGFLVMDFAPQFEHAISELAKWHSEGKLKNRTHITEGGLASAGKAFVGMMKGDNIGKALVKA